MEYQVKEYSLFIRDRLSSQPDRKIMMIFLSVTSRSK